MGLIFTYAATYGGAFISLFNPFIGLLVFVCFSIVRPESMWYWSVPAGNYSRIVAIALLAGWTFRGFGRWNFGRGRGIVWAFILFVAWNAISADQSEFRETAFSDVESILKILLMFLVGITVVDSVGKLKAIAWVIVLSQGFVGYEMNMAYLGGFNRVVELGFGGMDNNCVAIAMVAGTGLAFFLGMHTQSLLGKGLAFLSALFMGHTVLLAMSRGGMLGLIVTAIVSFVLIPKRLGHYLGFALAVIIGIYLAGPMVTERFATIFTEQRDSSAQSRLDMWKICLGVMRDHPILGLGPRHFPLNATRFGLTPLKEAHTLWLQVGAETGVVGLFFLLAFYLMCMKRLWPLAREKRPLADPWLAHFGRMVIASLAGFMVSATFVSLVGLELPYYVTLLGAITLKLDSQTQALAQVAGISATEHANLPLERAEAPWYVPPHTTPKPSTS
jgi:probable O-glycosylation ligase (exosortase A-associated)